MREEQKIKLHVSSGQRELLLTTAQLVLVMDVTRDNFVDTLPFFEKTVQECDFIAIDTEFTGLGKRGKFFDLPHHRYENIRQTVTKHDVIQLGVSCFKELRSDQYSCSSFNFFVFPYQVSFIPPVKQDLVIDIQTVTFLRSHDFDFNLLYSKGINYHPLEDEEKISQIVDKKNDNVPDAINVPDDEKEFIKNVVEKVDSFLIDSSDESLTLDPCSGYQRKLIYSTLGDEKYAGKIEFSLKKSDNSLRSLIVTKTSENKKEAERHRLITEAIGVSKVIGLISSSRKPLVGHNCLFDLAYIINQFISPLPPLYTEFKQMVHDIFPSIYDTKHLASVSGVSGFFEDTVLLTIFNRIQKEPFSSLGITMVSKNSVEGDGDNGCKSNDICKAHQASYDSYMTGHCFIALAKLIGKAHIKSSNSSTEKSASNLFSPQVVDLRNLVCIHYSFDYTHLNLSGTEEYTGRKDVFYVEFPKSWKTKDVQNLFAPARTRIEWHSDTSAFVALLDKSKASYFGSSQASSPEWKVFTYEEYRMKFDDSVNSQAFQESTSASASSSQDDRAHEEDDTLSSQSLSSQSEKDKKNEKKERKRDSNEIVDTSLTSKKARTSVGFPENLDW